MDEQTASCEADDSVAASAVGMRKFSLLAFNSIREHRLSEIVLIYFKCNEGPASIIRTKKERENIRSRR